MNLKEIIQRLEAKYGITGREGFTEELVAQIETEISPQKRGMEERVVGKITK